MTTGFGQWMLGWLLWREAARTTDGADRFVFRLGAISLMFEAVVLLVKTLTGVQHLYELWPP